MPASGIIHFKKSKEEKILLMRKNKGDYKMITITTTKEQADIVKAVLKEAKKLNDILATHLRITSTPTALECTDGKRAFIFNSISGNAPAGIYAVKAFTPSGKFTQLIIEQAQDINYPNIVQFFPAIDESKVFTANLKDLWVSSLIIKIFQKCGAAMRVEYLEQLPKESVNFYCYAPEKPILIVGGTWKAILLPHKIA